MNNPDKIKKQIEQNLINFYTFWQNKQKKLWHFRGKSVKRLHRTTHDQAA